MIKLKKCNKIFIDFDGVLVDSNKFKELAIEKSIFQLFGKTERSIKAINYFNINAGIARKKKLSLFFEDNQVSKIQEIYSKECSKFLSKASTTNGVREFIEFVKSKYKHIKLYILSGGEKEEIIFFLRRLFLFSFFEDILASEKNKIDHLLEKEVSENDIFIGDSINDLKAALSSGITFILFEEYKSLKSFPTEALIYKNNLLKTKNFESLMNQINL